MAFSIKRVGYRDFRNTEELVIEPGPRLTVLVGPNAAGKTNCVEGIQILTAGGSFRHVPPADMIRKGAERAQLRMHVESDKRMLDLAYDIFQTKKLLSINGKRRPNGEGRGILPSILFYPDELMVVKGGAADRRAMMDDFGVQMNASYAKVNSDYRRALRQRNMLYKEAARTGSGIDRTMLDAWTESLVAAGTALYRYRLSLVMRLAPHVARIYGELGAGEEAQMGYESLWFTGREPGENPGRAEVEEQLRSALERVRAEEARRCQTLAGPHLDDVAFSIAGLPARNFGSQGQQRSLVLAVKLAQVEVVHEMQAQYPVFLLDDVMSELDSNRRARLFDLVQGGMQTVVTTTNLEYFRPEELVEARVIHLGE